MSECFLESEKVRITFPDGPDGQDGNWVELKEELTQDDQDYIMTQMVKGKTGEALKTKIEWGHLPLLERSIVDWSFTGKDGNKMPITKDNISSLRLRYRAKLLIEIDHLNTQAMEFVTKN